MMYYARPSFFTAFIFSLAFFGLSFFHVAFELLLELGHAYLCAAACTLDGKGPFPSLLGVRFVAAFWALVLDARNAVGLGNENAYLACALDVPVCMIKRTGRL